MTTVQQLLSLKGHLVWSVAPAATVYDAIKKMGQTKTSERWSSKSKVRS